MPEELSAKAVTCSWVVTVHMAELAPVHCHEGFLMMLVM